VAHPSGRLNYTSNAACRTKVPFVSPGDFKALFYGDTAHTKISTPDLSTWGCCC